MSHESTHKIDYTATGGHDHDHGHHSTKTYWIVFGALMVLLFLTVFVAYFNLGVFNIPVAYLIASLKAILILWFFMHLNESTRLTQIFAFASFAWLFIFLIMTMGDYLSRYFVPRAEPLTHIRTVDSYEQASGVRSERLRPVQDGDSTQSGASAEPLPDPNPRPAEQPAQ